MIIDCFIFYNELDLLNYRLNILYDIIDKFVIVEATRTFKGNNKPLYYGENKHLFSKFNDKIIHIIVDNLIANPKVELDEVWANEAFQREAINKGIELLNLESKDLILISDLDEIPDPDLLTTFKYIKIKDNIAYNLYQELYIYNLHTKLSVNDCSVAKLVSYDFYKNILYSSPVYTRQSHFNFIPKSGWHLSYFGDKHFIKNKIQNFSHQEYNNDDIINLEKIENNINNAMFPCRNIKLDIIPIEQNKYLPPKYKEFLSKYI
jgi:beta-1,4-mannosyl-glycoprotein beta-1,4-N-acetylglucosaminyltransferase